MLPTRMSETIQQKVQEMELCSGRCEKWTGVMYLKSVCHCLLTEAEAEEPTNMRRNMRTQVYVASQILLRKRKATPLGTLHSSEPQLT